MKKGTKSFGGFIVVTLSAILIIAAIVAAAFYNEVVIPEPETQALAAGEEYVHGSNIGRKSSGNGVTTGDQLVSAINSNSNVNLLNNVSIPSSNFGSIAVYSGTIYGNGHKITINVPDSSGKNDRGRQFFGGLMGELNGGAIYDCTFDIGSGDYKGGYNDNTFFGAVTGSIYNATVENVTINILSGTDFRIYCHSSGQQVGIGMLSGYAGNATIRNVTINNNGGTYRAGYSSSDFNTIYTEASPSTVANLVGFFEGSASTVENIIIKGGSTSTTLDGQYASNLGLSAYAATTITVGNFYNAFLGTINAINNGGSVTFAKHISTSWGSTSYVGNVSVTRYFEYHNSDSDCVNQLSNHSGQYSNRQITEKLSVQTSGNDNVVNRQILFNPRTTDYANSLVLIYTNRELSNAIVGKQWTVTADSGRIFNGTEDGDGIVFANLPVADIWNDDNWGDGNGYFNATLSYTETIQGSYPALNDYEHGYVDDGYADSISGTALNSSNFYNTLIDKDSNRPSGTYKLTEDIVIEGFTGKEWNEVTLDGCGHTIYITSTQTGLGGSNIGGIVGKMTRGTIKNLRIVLAEDVTVATTGSKESNDVVAIGIGAVAGQLTGGATIQNVNVVIPEGVRFSNSWSTGGSDRALGGIAGEIVGSGHIIGCTVQLDGQMIAESGWPFAAGLAGITEDISGDISGAPSVTFENNILKGSGQLGGIANNTDQPTFCAAITTTQPGSSNAFTVDGFIYNLTNTSPTVGSLNGNDQLTNDLVSSFGYVCQNNDTEGTGTSAGLDPSGVVNDFNIFDYGASMSEDLVYYDEGDGNVYYNIPTTAAISGSVENLDRSTVTPYFRPSSTTEYNAANITLVASASDWSGFELLKADGASTALSVDSGSDKVIDVAKNNAASEGAITVIKFETVEFGTDGALNSLTYTGEGQDATANLVYQGSTYGGTYSLSYTANGGGASLSDGKPLTAGNYLVTITLTGNEFFYYNGAASKTYTGLGLRMDKALVPFGVSLGNDSLTYTASELTGDPSVIATSGGDKYDHLLDDLGTVTFTYTPSGESSPLSGDPTNAGTYTVSFTYTNTANVGLSNTIRTATLTINPKTVELAANSVEKTFASDTGAITSANVNANDTYGLTINGFIDSDTNAAYTVSLASPVYIEENGTSTEYLAADEYTLTVTLSSSNYTFGTTSGENTDTVTVNVAQGSNSVSTEYARDNWVYYNTPSAQNFQMRFGTPTFSYRNTTTEQVFDSMTSTSPVGTYSVTVTVAETTSYSAFEQTFSGAFQITALPVSITLTAQDAVYSAKQYAESNITVSLGGSYTATDVAAILGEITYKHRLASATEAEYIQGLPTDAGEYVIGIHELGNMTAGNVGVSDLDAITAGLVINKKTVAFDAATPGGTNLGYGSAADPMDVVNVSAVIPEGFESDFTADDWSWNAVFEEGYGASTAVGTSVTLTVSVTITDDNYTAQLDQSEFEFTVVQATLTLRVEGFGTLENGASGWIYDGTAHELTVSVPDDLVAEVVLTYYTVSDGSYTAIEGNIAPTDAGNYAVTASISGDKNYADVTSKYFEYTIQKAQMVIEVTMNGWIYNGNAGTAAVVSGQRENAVTAVKYIGTPNGGTTDEYNSPDVPTNAGSYRVVVSVEDTANYFGVSETVVPFTVERAALSDLSVSVEGWTYDATDHYLSSIPVAIENNNGNGNVSYAWYSVSGEQQVGLDTDYIRNAGEYRVTATVAQTNNYLEGTASHDFTVAKHEVTVKTAPYEFAYGVLTTTNANNATNFPGAVTGFLGGEADSSFELSLGYSGQVTDGYVNAREYDLTVTLINTNYTFKTADGTLSGTATIPVVVNKTDNSTTSDYSRSGWTYYNSPSVDEILPKFRFGSEAAIEVKYYTDPERQNEYTDGFTYVTAAETYYVAVTMPGTDNYNELTVYGQFTVAQREVTITVADISNNTYYYGDMIEPSATIPASGFGTDYIGTVSWTYKEADSQEDVWTALPDDGIFDVGTYTIRFNYTNTANVALDAESVIETTVTINRRAVEFTVSLEEGAKIVYGMTLEEVRALVLISTDTELEYGSEIGVMAGGTAYSETVNAGTLVTVTVEITVTNTNYTATVSGETKYELTVAKRAVTIAVDETATMLHANYNQFDPTPFYGHIRIEGLLNGDVKENVFNIALPVVSDTPTTDAYEVNVSLNTDFAGYANYEFGETTKWVISLTLSAREFTFTVQMKESFVYGKEIDGMKLTIVQPEGEEEIPSSVLHQPMTFRYIGVDGTEYDSNIAPVNVGSYTLTVTITGTADYHSEPATSKVFEITPAPLTMTIDAAAGGLSTTYDPNTEITDFMAAFAEYFTVAFPADGAYTDEFGDIFSLSATKDNDGAVESIKNAGAYTLTPTLINKNYSIKDIPSLTHTVNKANMSVTVSVESWAYGEYSSELNAPVISGIMEDADLLEGYSEVYMLKPDESDIPSGEPIVDIANANVGTYILIVTVPATDNYIGMTAEATFYITKTTFESAVTITGWTYGEYDAELNAPSVHEDGNPGNADVRYTYTGRNGTEYDESEEVPQNAGYYTVTAYIDGSVNYEALEVSCNFAIDKASVSPAIDAELSKTYDGDAVAFTLTEGSNPGMGEVTYVIEREISGEYVTVTEARYSGNYRVRATVSETANHSGATTEPVTFAIGQKAVTASWSVANAALVYGDSYDEALALILIDRKSVLAQFAAGDGEYVEFILDALAADGSDYSERVNAGTAVTFGLSIAFAEGTAQDIVGSYDISVSVEGAGSKTVAPRSIEITATDTSDIYGSSFTADGSLAEYFAENFTYNGTSVNAIADEYTTVAFAVNGTSGAAIPNAGTYTVTVTVGGNYTGAASAAYTIEQKTLTVAAGYELPFGVLSAENIAEYGYEALLGGFVGDESVDYTVRADDELGDEDSSFGFLNVNEYVLMVEIAENTNYKFETGYTAKFTVNIEKTDNAWIVEYARGDWTYLSEPAAVTSPEARFAESDIDVRYYADSGYTVEMAPEAFTAATPAGTYYVTVSVPGSDNFNALRAEYSFEIYRLRAEMEVSTPEAVYDGEPYDGLTYTVSGAAADVVGEIGWMYIGEGMSDYVSGLPVDAGSYAVRIASVENLSIDIINITETFALVIDPATVNFTVRIASGMSVTYGDEITNAAAFVNTPVPDIDVGEFTYTVTAYNSRGALYTSGLQAGEQVSFAVEVTIEDTNYVANVRSTPSLTVRRLALEPEIVVGDETVTHGDEISVSNGSEFLVIDAITRYMADNGVRYYEYAIYVNGARYTTDYAFTPGEYEISVAIDGNFSGELRLTVNVDGNPELSVASAEPETAIGRFLDSINLSVAGAVAILLGFMVSLVVCLLIGLRKRGSE